jgi:hypothetical protein
MKNILSKPNEAFLQRGGEGAVKSGGDGRSHRCRKQRSTAADGGKKSRVREVKGRWRWRWRWRWRGARLCCRQQMR